LVSVTCGTPNDPTRAICNVSYESKRTEHLGEMSKDIYIADVVNAQMIKYPKKKEKQSINSTTM
jgi:hypothetical protein